MIQRSKLGLNFFARRFRRHVYLRDLSIVVMRDTLQSRYLRRRVAHKQLARTSLNTLLKRKNTKNRFFFLLLVILCPKVFKAEILPGYCTDHSMIVIQQKLHTLVSIKRS